MLYRTNRLIFDFKSERRLVASCTSEATTGSEHTHKPGVPWEFWFNFLSNICTQSFPSKNCKWLSSMRSTLKVLAVKFNVYSKIDEAMYTDFNPLISLLLSEILGAMTIQRLLEILSIHCICVECEEQITWVPPNTSIQDRINKQNIQSPTKF